jgi:hypothetical protein
MSLLSWLQNLRSALASRRGHRPHGRRGSRRAATHRFNVEVLEDRSVPAFLAPVDYFVGGNLQDVVAADFNNDTMPDLAVVSFDNSTVSVLLGNGNGTFRAPQISAAGSYPRALAVGDFDGDGNLDLATANTWTEDNWIDVSVLLGDGTGRFTPAGGSGYFVYGDPQAMTVGDFNGDGLLDLGVNSNEEMEGQFANVLLGNGDGSFSWTASTYLGDGAFGDIAVAAADLNGDGFDDFVTATGLGPTYAHVLLSNNSGGFQNHSSFFLGNYQSLDDNPAPVAAADLDADGDTDLVVMDRVLLGDGTGRFSVGGYAAGTYGAVLLGDFTGDGNLDVAQADWGTVTIRRGQGNGAFSAAEIFAAHSGPYAIAAADFNGDGRLDVATVSSNAVSVFINDRSWPFVPPTVSINDATVNEGNAGTVNATFNVTLSYASNVAVTVHYATADITATAGSDYTAASGTVTIPAGQTSAPVTVAVRGDRLGEPDETFAANLSTATNATIGDGQGIGTILDNEPRLRISDVTKAEGKRNKTTLFTFTVTLSAVYDQPVSVSFRTVNGTATTGDGDYVDRSGTLTFAPGETTKTITIEVKGDSKREADEVFYVDLFGNSSNSWLEKSRGVGTILNDD